MLSKEEYFFGVIGCRVKAQVNKLAMPDTSERHEKYRYRDCKRRVC